MLTNSFNKMISELDRSRKKIIQTEKVAAWQEIAQRLAHEIRNPLTPIKLSAQRILKKHQTDKDEMEKILVPALTAIIKEVDNLNDLLSEFRDFSRLPAPTLEECDLKGLIEDVCKTYRSSSPLISFHLDLLDENLKIKIDPLQIKQVFANLFKNAAEALRGSGEIHVRADLVKKGNSDYCRIQVQDTGSGIKEDNQAQVFNPYFTTKTHGTGLGLAIVERIIFDHQGQIWFESQNDVGTTFFIDLPMQRK